MVPNFFYKMALWHSIPVFWQRFALIFFLLTKIKLVMYDKSINRILTLRHTIFSFISEADFYFR